MLIFFVKVSMMVACLQSWNMFLDSVLMKLFTNQVVFDGTMFSFWLNIEAQQDVK
jgi:hypothetical protein